MSTPRCRVCLSENDCVYNIFADKCSNGQLYSEALMSCIDGVTVTENDTLPSHICEACVSELESWATCGKISNDFVMKYISSTSTNIKVESDYDDGQPVRQIIDRTTDIETEEIFLKTEPDDEYFQNNIDKPISNPPAMIRFECDLCDKTFGQLSSLNVHRRVHTGKKRFKCDRCEKAFHYRALLTEHIRKHTGEKPYKCAYCERKFDRKSIWHAHMRTHTGEKPYSCDHCTKTFARKAGLKLHQWKHTGEKPFKCDRCEKAFPYQILLVEHIRKHTGERPYLCDICNKSFIRNYLLQQHRRRHTGVVAKK